jgi:hypothetical protein
VPKVHVHVYDQNAPEDITSDNLVAEYDSDEICDYGDYKQYGFERNGEWFEIRVNAELEETLFSDRSGGEFPRLQELRDGVKPTDGEITELWNMFKQSEAYVGETPTMMDFGQFLMGMPEFDSTDQPAIPPATITW